MGGPIRGQELFPDEGDGNREWEQGSKHSFSLSSLYILFLLIERILCSQEAVRKRKNGFVMRFFAPAIFRLMGTGMGTEWEQDGNRRGNKPSVLEKNGDGDCCPAAG